MNINWVRTEIGHILSQDGMVETSLYDRAHTVSMDWENRFVQCFGKADRDTFRELVFALKYSTLAWKNLIGTDRGNIPADSRFQVIDPDTGIIYDRRFRTLNFIRNQAHMDLVNFAGKWDIRITVSDMDELE